MLLDNGLAFCCVVEVSSIVGACKSHSRSRCAHVHQFRVARMCVCLRAHQHFGIRTTAPIRPAACALQPHASRRTERSRIMDLKCIIPTMHWGRRCAFFFFNEMKQMFSHVNNRTKRRRCFHVFLENYLSTPLRLPLLRCAVPTTAAL